MSGSSLAEHALPGTVVPVPLQQAQPLDSVVVVTQSVVSVLPQQYPSDLRSLQEADPLLRDALVFWRQKARPTPTERQQVPTQVLALLRQWDRLMEREGVLYRQVFCPDGGEESSSYLPSLSQRY